MRHYLLYHNPEAMGYDFDGNYVDGSEDEVAVYNNYWQTYGTTWADWKPEDPANNTVHEWEHLDSEDIFNEDDFRYRIATNNRMEAEESVGNCIWVVQGAVGTSPRRFFLHGFFFANGFVRKQISVERKRFKYLVYGDEGEMDTIEYAVEVTSLEWFRILKRIHKNFRVGFREIKDSGLIAELEDCFQARQKGQQ